MGFLDHQGGAEFPYSREDVFNAVYDAIPTIKNMRLHSADKLSGHIVVKAGASMMSWGENIPIDVAEVAPGRTRVSITSTPKTGVMFGGAIDFGKNRKNLEMILAATSKQLSGKPPAVPAPAAMPPSSGPSPAERLSRLKELKDQDLINDDEYEQRRSQILEEL